MLIAGEGRLNGMQVRGCGCITCEYQPRMLIEAMKLELALVLGMLIISRNTQGNPYEWGLLRQPTEIRGVSPAELWAANIAWPSSFGSPMSCGMNK